MGGKRPDQYAIDPGEANATDYKERHAEGGIREQDKQKVKASETQEREQATSHIPEHGENPAKAELKARKDSHRAGSTDESRSDNQSVDEASMESFPASDPPAWGG